MVIQFIVVPVLLCVIGSLVVSGQVTNQTAKFKPLCDIHTKNPGHRTPNQVLPSQADDAWLYATKANIEKWYVVGKIECEAYLDTARRDLESGHGEYFSDQKKIPSKPLCRGQNTLLDFSGTILWPFGPYKECTTYSKCWFGLLTCGEPKNDAIKSTTAAKLAVDLRQQNVSVEIPAYTKFSVRALHMLIRVVGAEIVVPEQKYVTLANKADVIVGQYVLTRVHADTKLEMRMFEFYPSLLFDWTKEELRHRAPQNRAAMHLGGCEGRCRPWTRCVITNNCCGCDEKSFVFNTPVTVVVTDGQSRCPAVREKELPLCAMRDSRQPGRWINSGLSELTPQCGGAGATPNTLFHKDVKHISGGANHPGEILKQPNFNLSAHQYTGPAWFEASGDPCLVNAKESEENGKSHWFYAPYTCKYHFYNPVELHKCLMDKKLNHVHVSGDSMARDLFGYLSLYLGVPQMTDAEHKHLTNDLNQKNIQTHSGNVILSEGYSWDFDLNVAKLSEISPRPNIYITNYGLAHRNWNLPKFQELFGSTEYDYWTQKRSKSTPLPEFLFHQNAKEMTGRRTINWSANTFRKDSSYLTHNYTALGFSELDEFLFSSGRYEFHEPLSDGWHFGGTKRQMEVVALFNMVCNDWLAEVKG